jgi:hypothetical protein
LLPKIVAVFLLMHGEFRVELRWAVQILLPFWFSPDELGNRDEFFPWPRAIIPAITPLLL